jgi:phosphoribosylaminoimidazolecarboxamide formyltransferase/IMP cyclohydrolase
MIKKLPNILKIKLKKLFETRYGENPHQKGAFLVDSKSKDKLAIQNFKKIHGKEISFNNLLDVNAAILAISELGGKKPACVIIKHGNPCGTAYGENPKAAFLRAWYKGDSLAAFGGVIGINGTIDENLAKLMIKNFFEVLITPKIQKEALKVFSQRSNLIILVNPALRSPKPSGEVDVKKIRGGFLIQESDLKEIKEKDLKFPTKKKPTKKQMKDLLFAWKICKVSKSNAIVLVKEETLISSGVGQQDRKRACQLAIKKAGKGAKNTVAASDGFFPFSDAPKLLIKAGIKAIIQPGGSIHDKDIIKLCDRYNIPMVLTKIRCFKH